MSKLDNNICMEKIKKVLGKEPDVVFAYLYGSYAKGTHNEKSDIDIAIFLRDQCLLERDPLYPSRLAIKIERELAGNKNIDMRVLNDSTLRFKSQVLRYGKLLHSKDEMKRIEFETRSLAYYYDFKPFLEMYDAARKTRMGL